jgi:hypothetical protein
MSGADVNDYRICGGLMTGNDLPMLTIEQRILIQNYQALRDQFLADVSSLFKIDPSVFEHAVADTDEILISSLTKDVTSDGD